jgi:hypothetical protein
MKSSWQPMKPLKEFLKRLARFFGVGVTETPDRLPIWREKLSPEPPLKFFR